jgi:hypothetical protein
VFKQVHVQLMSSRARSPSRRHAPRPRPTPAPAALEVRAACHLRQCAFPRPPVPRGALRSTLRHAPFPYARRTDQTSAASDRWSVRSLLPLCTVPWPAYSVPWSLSKRVSPIKGRRPLPRAHERHCLTLLRHRPLVDLHRRDSGLARRRRPPPLTYSLDHLRARRAAHSLAPATSSLKQGAQRLAPAVAARTTPPAPPPPQTPIEIEPWDPADHPPPAPGRSRPLVRRNLAGPPPAGARGPHCEGPSLSEGLSANRGLFCKGS